MSFEQADTPTCNTCVWRPNTELGGFKRISNAPRCPTHDPQKPWPVETCRSPTCGRPIIWAKTEAMRSMPVNAEPDPDGNLLLWWDLSTVRSRVLRSTRQRFGKTLYSSHFATCRDADKWRQRP
jgi:hypothetical protein